MEIESTPDLVSKVYEKAEQNVSKFRKMLGRPLTLSEKILAAHFMELDQQNEPPQPGKSYVFLKPDRVALQDVTGQMVVLQFMQSGLKRVNVPTTVHCDHLIQARVSGDVDTLAALDENSEVYRFLESASRKYGMGFWKPGAGIIHQVVLENYAFPGGLMIGTDSHTPNAGGLGMLAVGVGGIDAAEVMSGLPWEILYPKKIGVHLKGELNGWASPKDIILYVAWKLTVSGGTNHIIEYFGPGARSISCTGKATITNMGAEIGATTSVFSYDKKMDLYLRTTGREKLAELANQYSHLLNPDPEIEEEPEKYFDKVLEIDLSQLEPHIVGPHTPDLARPVSKLPEDVQNKDYMDDISVALIGSCTNSSYEDMTRASGMAEQARKKGLKTKIPLLVTPGSEQIRATIERDGQMESLKSIGATVLANACGPCIGQWKRPELKAGEKNTIITSFNRNFPGRNDGRRETMSFMGSPEVVIAFALAGKLSFNPMTDTIQGEGGVELKLDPPPKAPEVPSDGFATAKEVYVEPSSNPDEAEVEIPSGSERLQKLEPFPAWSGKDFAELHILLKAKGKCTTDHISPAGAWLRYRGNLDKISDNAFLGAVNAFDEQMVGKGKNQLTAKVEPFPEIARQYKKQGIDWIVIGDHNYGEGSSREHAAMSPRYLGCVAVIAKSFARIHETNLKKQGILALTFDDPSDYDKIGEDDRISITGIKDMEPGKPLTGNIHHYGNGKNNYNEKEQIKLNHSYNDFQIKWFKAGSALNVLKKTEE